MKIKTNSLCFYLILFFSILMAIVPAHFDGTIISVLNKSLYLCTWLLFSIVILRSKPGKILFVLKTSGSIFFIYLFLQTGVTLFTAGSTLKIALSNIMFISVFFCVFMIAALQSSEFQPFGLNKILTFFIILALLSTVLDVFGYTQFFLGKYGDANLERFNFAQVHGFMPWPNIFATFLMTISILLTITRPSNATSKLGYLLILPTIVRAHILTGMLLLVLDLKKNSFKMIAIFLLIVAGTYFAATIDYSEQAEVVMSELNPENTEKIYRVAYINETINILHDYPFTGIGLNRLSNRAFWEFDNFQWHLKYGLPDTLFGKELSTSDTGFTFFAEIGLIGTAFYLAGMLHFLYLSIKQKKYRYGYFLIPQVTLLYSFPSMLFSLSFGMFFWFFYGLLISADYQQRRLDTGDCL